MRVQFWRTRYEQSQARSARPLCGGRWGIPQRWRKDVHQFTIIATDGDRSDGARRRAKLSSRHAFVYSHVL